MKTIKDLQKVINNRAPNAPIFIQAGFNRFEINSYVIQEDGSLLLLLEEDANNPVVEYVEPPKELA